jgi:hypothetical protein
MYTYTINVTTPLRSSIYKLSQHLLSDLAENDENIQSLKFDTQRIKFRCEESYEFELRNMIAMRFFIAVKKYLRFRRNEMLRRDELYGLQRFIRSISNNIDSMVETRDDAWIMQSYEIVEENRPSLIQYYETHTSPQEEFVAPPPPPPSPPKSVAPSIPEPVEDDDPKPVIEEEQPTMVHMLPSPPLPPPPLKWSLSLDVGYGPRVYEIPEHISYQGGSAIISWPRGTICVAFEENLPP